MRKQILILAVLAAFFCLCRTHVQAVETIVYVGFQPDSAPFQFLEDGQPCGLHIDIMDAVARNSNFTIRYLPFATNSQALEALEREEIDLVLGVVPDGNPDYKERYSESITQSYLTMFTKKERAEEIKANMAHQPYFAAYEMKTLGSYYSFSIKNLYNILAPNQAAALDMLKNGQVDILIGVRDSVLWLMRQSGIEGDYTVINNLNTPVQYSILAKDSADILLGHIDREINAMRFNGEYDRLYSQWCGDENYALSVFIRRTFRVTLIVGAIVALVIGANLWVNHLLRTQVTQKTVALQKANQELEQQMIQIKNSNELRNKIVENNPVGIVVFNMENEITLVNQSAYYLLGIEGDYVGRSIFDIPLLIKILGEIPNLFTVRDKYKLGREMTLDFGGQSVIYHYDIQPLYSTKEQLRGAVLSIEDATDKVRAKNHLYEQEKNRSLNLILAGIAHEVRNPLTSIKTFIEMIPYARGDSAFERELTDIVPKEIERVSTLIKNLMDYARPDENNKNAVIVRDVVYSCQALLHHTCERARIHMEMDVDDTMVVLADKNQLKQILINIVLNSIEAVKPGAGGAPRVVIRTWQDEENAYIRIYDEGVGMTPAELKSAAEPFFTTKASGTGLGLYMAKQYIEENGGRFDIISQKGLFTQVTLTFRRLEAWNAS